MRFNENYNVMSVNDADLATLDGFEEVLYVDSLLRCLYTCCIQSRLAVTNAKTFRTCFPFHHILTAAVLASGRVSIRSCQSG